MRKVSTILAILWCLQFSATAQQSVPALLAAPSAQAEKLIRLYPNPAISYVTFELRDEMKKGLTLQVYNGLLGKKMYESRFPGDRFTLNLNEYSRGLYIYHLIDASGKIIESGKFQVSK